MSAKYRSGFDYFTEVFSKEYKVDKSILAGAAREVWENELTDEDRASWEEMARLSEQEESAAKAEQKKAEDKKGEEDKKAEEAKKKAEEEKKAAEAKKAEEERKAAEAKKKAEEERKAAEAKKAEEEKKAAEAKKKAEDERKAAEVKKVETPEFSASKSPISGAEAERLSTPEVSQQSSMGIPPGIKEPAGMEAGKPSEQEPPKGSPAAASGMDIDKLKQAIGKRVSSQDEFAVKEPAAEAKGVDPAPGPEHDQQFAGFRDTLSNSGFFTSSGPIKSGLTISADRPRQIAKEAPVDRTSGSYASESIPEIQDPSAVSLDAPSAAVMRQKLMEKAEELAEAVISKALEGDVQSLTLCIERVLAPAEEYRLHIDLPPLDTREHVLQASEAVVRAVSLGELDPHQARALHELIEAHWRILEGSEISHRLLQLEQRGPSSKRQKITLGAFDKPF
ncbi:MAG: hypothetical protein ACOCWR_05055 [Oceanidesulfovibrio sp.]